MSTTLSSRAIARALMQRMYQTLRRRSRSFPLGTIERLEPKVVMSAVTPIVQMLSATTADSKSVTIKYEVDQPVDAANSIQFGIYRSSDNQLNSSDSLIDSVTLAPPGTPSAQYAITLDQSGQSASAIGIHTLTIPLSQGLPPFPEKPYVLIVANPSLSSGPISPQQIASFRTYTIGIVTHGGIQDASWKHGPPWETETAMLMREQGFDSVISYNWVQKSSTPGQAIKQSPRLTQMILDVARNFPASAPVNLEFIGHSEGTVINTYAIVTLENKMIPQLASGYIEDTMLDPHAANNNLPGQQMSFGGALGGLARAIVTNYQSSANDPPVFVPAIVDQAQVFFEHSQATAGEIYNLWGQVPVRSNGVLVHYYNLTDMGVTHSGKTGVNYWFRNFIAPTLGDQAPLVQELQLDGQIDGSTLLTTSAAQHELGHTRSQCHPGQPHGRTGACRTHQSASVFRNRCARFHHPTCTQPSRQTHGYYRCRCYQCR